MEVSEKQKFIEVVSVLAENFEAELSKVRVQMLFDALKQYSIDRIHKAGSVLLRKDRTYAKTKFPTVHEFEEAITGNTQDLTVIAHLEAVKVVNAVRRIGGYKSVKFRDGTTQAVIMKNYHGWVELCRTVPDDAKWFIKDFERSYLAYKRGGVEHRGRLAGQLEIENERWADDARFSQQAILPDVINVEEHFGEPRLIGGGVGMIERRA